MAVVTISRQTGSLGEEIAALLSKRLNHELVDDQKIHKLAESCDDEYKSACSAYEVEAFKGWFERVTFNRPAYRSLFEALNFELAAKGDVILLGRGVEIVLKDFPQVTKVRIAAPDALRTARIAEQLKMSLSEATDYMRSQDLNRRAMMRAIYDTDQEDFRLYDLIINTGGVGVEAAAEMILAGVADKAHHGGGAFPADTLQQLAVGKRLESLIRKQVATLSFMEGIHVVFKANGNVTLNGFVASDRDRETAHQAAVAYPGVYHVNNQLRVVIGI
ncbi:MAG: cytidylate kinase family protein [Deltaproteobacteria bacterium]|nr:cytidylate kinase family protein [Deltaproteobacteria bacterium]